MTFDVLPFVLCMEHTGILLVANSTQAGITEGEAAGDKKPLEGLLMNAQDIILQGSLDMLQVELLLYHLHYFF